MKLSLVSDLHIDVDGAKHLNLPGGEILLLAGDLCEVGSLNPRFRLAKLREAIANTKYDDEIKLITDKIAKEEERASRLLELLNLHLAKYDKVYAVLGNHEHYNCNYDVTAELYKEILPNVTLLENTSVPLSDNVRLFGATLWTDLDKQSPLIIGRAYAWNDYVMTTIGLSNRRLQAQDTWEAFRKTVSKIYECAQDNPYQKIIVMTHFAPTEQSVPPRFKNHPDNSFFHSDLINVMLDNKNIEFWVHGHMHSRSDYRIGGCRVLCNSRGYIFNSRREETGFDPGFSFHI